MSGDRQATGMVAEQPWVIGIVGAGQLARMICEAASPLDIGTVVLAEHGDNAAVPVANQVLEGSPMARAALTALAERCSVVTFDHELVDLDLLGELEAAGHAVRPGVDTLRMAVDKAVMRARLDRAGIPVPAYLVLTGPGGLVEEGDPPALRGGGDAREVLPPLVRTRVEGFSAEHGWPLVLKATRGGYDGKGVWPVRDMAAVEEVWQRARRSGTSLLMEEFVAIEAELAVLVARRPGGASVAWPPVETAQVDGVCREVLVPGRLDGSVRAMATDVAERVAAEARAVGVLAVEFFVTNGSILVNEVAARPHNSGHWTIEGAVTSQFENHLRGVLDLPLGETTATAPQVTSVNLFGAPDGNGPAGLLPGALAVGGAHVHLYGKAPRPGRKLGHVTVTGHDADDVRRRAWSAARALGSPLPAGLGLDTRAPT